MQIVWPKLHMTNLLLLTENFISKSTKNEVHCLMKFDFALIYQEGPHFTKPCTSRITNLMNHDSQITFLKNHIRSIRMVLPSPACNFFLSSVLDPQETWYHEKEEQTDWGWADVSGKRCLVRTFIAAARGPLATMIYSLGLSPLWEGNVLNASIIKAYHWDNARFVKEIKIQRFKGNKWELFMYITGEPIFMGL